MRPTLGNVQAVRGLACLLVVLYHVGGWEVVVWPRVKLLYPVRWFGYAGVDVFFALSGFIIARAHLHQLGQPRHLPRYLFRRAWRIYPPLWAAMLTTAGLAYLVAGQDVFTPGWEADWLAWLTLAPTATGNAVLPVAWSLTYEAMFYLAFAALFVVPRAAAGPLAVAWGVGVLAAKAVGWQPASPWAALPVSPFVLEFLFGALAAVPLHRNVVWRPRACLMLAGGWAVVGSLLLAGPGPDDLGGRLWHRVLVFGPASGLFVYAAAAGERTGRITLPRRLRPLGDASYAIYLFHGTFCVSALFLTFGISHRFAPHLVWLAVMLASGVGGGYLAHRLIERPLMRSRRAANSGEHRPDIVYGRVTADRRSAALLRESSVA